MDGDSFTADKVKKESKQEMDKWDVLISASSGALTAAMDILWTGDISLQDAHSWGLEKTEAFVLKLARSKGYKGNELNGAINTLENLYPIDADKLSNDFGGGKNHHLRDFTHHPTPIGLIFSMISQFSGRIYGTDVHGVFMSKPIPGWSRPDLLTGIYRGSYVWLLHMISDMAGSSSSAWKGHEGTGLPGPIMSFLKEVSSMPGIRAIAGKNDDEHYNFSVTCSKLFNGTLLGEHDENGKITKHVLRFDLRTELGIANEALKSKQYIPVAINEALVCAFYSISRLVRRMEAVGVRELSELNSLDFSEFLPWKSPALRHMRTIASASFSVIEISSAGIKAYLKNKGNKSGFALDFLQSINYIGLGRLTFALVNEANSGIASMYKRFAALTAQLEAGSGLTDSVEMLKKSAVSAAAVLKLGTPEGFIAAAVGVYNDISSSIVELNIAREERLRIEKECAAQIQVIQENRQHIELAVEAYMQDRLLILGAGLDDMDSALVTEDSDLYLHGGAAIQQKLGKSQGFESQKEFDELMQSDTAFKL